MYKQIMLLGILLEKPLYGQQIREVIETHHDLFANHIKKPTIYYQLERLVADGYLEMRREPVEAPGPGAAHEDRALRERDLYYVTEAGKSHFTTLLRAMISEFSPGFSEVDVCLYFLHHLSAQEACTLLNSRLQLIMTCRTSVARQMDTAYPTDAAHQLVTAHKLLLLDAEIQWLRSAIACIGTGSLTAIPDQPPEQPVV
ncbi:PadR family transcriptional regulator [Dictyobacter arantiisoli]|uniref:Transcription regulator PadR N-terminal domain-containing protein n=1 Tax=Dictyobacter arantiisoli TaxID=2014874 RepID=A0A5A5T9V0_9CHLR|nr:PadR family transcriptional regulator [Dictyobacter arantiisoli]GCF08168.1 hypothetical protein KDI_17320 [Dictyobacter arantiisoli]